MNYNRIQAFWWSDLALWTPTAFVAGWLMQSLHCTSFDARGETKCLGHLIWQELPESNRDRTWGTISQSDIGSDREQQYATVSECDRSPMRMALLSNHFGDFGWGWACNCVALYHVHQLYTGISNVWSLTSPGLQGRLLEWSEGLAHCLSRTSFLDIASIRLMPFYIQTSNTGTHTHRASVEFAFAHCCASNHVASGIVLCAQKLATWEVRCTLPLYELPGRSHCHLHSCSFLASLGQILGILRAILWP